MSRAGMFLFFLLAIAPLDARGGGAETKAALAQLPWERVQQSPAGSWVELALLVGGVPAGPHLRFLVLEREAEGTWVELWISQGAGSASLVYQMLVTPEAQGRLAIRRLLSRTLGGPVQELPVEHLAPAPAAPGAWPAGASWRKEAAPAALLTPAGSFRTQAWALRRGTSLLAKIWRSTAIPVFGVARVEYGEGLFGLEVAAFGSEGRPLIPSTARTSPPAGTAPP